MLDEQILQRLDLTRLAVMCQNVADDPSVDAVTAERAWGLKREWIVLVASETPLPPDLATQRQIDTKKAALKKRMFDFLRTV